jgi:hypothetical protein
LEIESSPDGIKDMDNFIEEKQRMKQFIHSVTQYGGSDMDWFIEINKGFIFFEMKKLRNGNIELYQKQMIPLIELHRALRRAKTKCTIFFIGFDDPDFGKNEDDIMWYFTMNQFQPGNSLNDYYRKIAWLDEKYKKWNVSTRDIRKTTLRKFRWTLGKTVEALKKES